MKKKKSATTRFLVPLYKLYIWINVNEREIVIRRKQERREREYKREEKESTRESTHKRKYKREYKRESTRERERERKIKTYQAPR